LVGIVTNDFLFRGGVVTSMLWWAWFRESNTRDRDRQIILSGAFASLLTVLAARGLVASLPFRQRPFNVPSLNFHPPLGLDQSGLMQWSSFPSDHAVLYFSLATIIFLVSRRGGIYAYIFVFFVVCLPRVYLGIHYPTDIIAGALLGVGAALLYAIPAVREPISAPLLHWHQRAPGSFYALFYLSTFLLATNAESLRTVLTFSIQVLLGPHHHAH
jgi:undecaprenyl-diphosphatase